MSDTTICISTETFKFEIEMALSHARAALTTENPKYCQMGLIALAKALALSELVADHREQLTGKDPHVFAEYKEACVKLINAFWKDFGLVLLQRVQTEEEKRQGTPGEMFVAKVQPVERPAKPVMPRPRPQPPTNGNGDKSDNRGHQIDPVVKQHIIANLEPPPGISRNAWFVQLAEEYEVSSKSIWNWYTAKQNGGAQAN